MAKRRASDKRERKARLRFYLSEGELETAKRLAARKGWSYQTLLRVWITERERQERAAEAAPSPLAPSAP